MTFNNPAKRNALSAEIRPRCRRPRRAAADDAVRVVVLSGAGGSAFVSGADIAEFGEQRTSPGRVLAYDEARPTPAGRGPSSRSRSSP